MLLEPIFAVEVVTPEEFMGDVIGDLSRRRGQIAGMEQRGNAQVISATVPLAEMFGYATDVRSNTQGRATYTMQFERYDEVPPNIAERSGERSRLTRSRHGCLAAVPDGNPIPWMGSSILDERNTRKLEGKSHSGEGQL